jgi:hypothetical protein
LNRKNFPAQKQKFVRAEKIVLGSLTRRSRLKLRVGAERIASKLFEICTNGKYTERGARVGHRSAWTIADAAANMGNYFSAVSKND